jgi:hypothetical protein
MLYLSLYLKKHREDYYRLLQEVRVDGNWEDWLTFFLTGILETSTAATQTARRLLQIFQRDSEIIRSEVASVIVPILHDADATADDIFKSPAFKEILTTLRALAANDDRIIEYFRSVSQGRQRKGGGSVQFDIDERLAKRINLADFAREIELRCWDRSRNSHGDRLRKRGSLFEHWGLRVAANGRSSVKATC